MVQVLPRDPGGVGIGAWDQVSAGVHEHLVEPERVREAVHFPLPPSFVADAPGPPLTVVGERSLHSRRGIVGHEAGIRLVEERPVPRFEFRPTGRVAAEIGLEGRRQRGFVGDEPFDQFPGTVVVHVRVHVERVARVAGRGWWIGHRGFDTGRVRQVAGGAFHGLPGAVDRAVGTGEDGRPGAVGLFDPGDVVLQRHRAVVEHQRVGAGFDKGPRQFPGLVHGMRIPRRRQDGLEPRAAVGNRVEAG